MPQEKPINVNDLSKALPLKTRRRKVEKEFYQTQIASIYFKAL